jgi:hypothetical protein
MLSINTTAGPKEVATLRLKDVDLERRIITVQPEGAKNPHRIRPIPLNDEAFKAAEMAVTRARRLRATEPTHYVFPFRIRTPRALFDPNRHQTSFRTAWKKMIAVAGLPRFRMYDLRHHAITALLENPHTSEETVEAIAGHISRQMKKRYSHVRMDAIRKAVSGLDGSTAELSSDEGPAYRNQDVLDMLTGLSPRIVAEQIKHSPGNFDTSPEALKKLQSQGVPEVVILAMFHAKKRRAA